MAEIVALRPEVDETTVKELRWLLKQAEAGKVVGFAFVTISPRGTVCSGWHGRGADDDIIRLCGATAILHSRAVEHRKTEVVSDGEDLE